MEYFNAKTPAEVAQALLDAETGAPSPEERAHMARVLNPTSWALRVFERHDSKGATSSVRLATKEEAEAHGRELFSRWLMPERFEAEPSDDPVNYTADLETGRLSPANRG